MLEFEADPTSPAYDKSLDPNRTVVTYCAVGGRAALATAALKELGYKDIQHMGGFKDWAEKGLPVDKA
jgi:rhodanese-related sulfurtransferase